MKTIDVLKACCPPVLRTVHSSLLVKLCKSWPHANNPAKQFVLLDSSSIVETHQSIRTRSSPQLKADTASVSSITSFTEGTELRNLREHKLRFPRLPAKITLKTSRPFPPMTHPSIHAANPSQHAFPPSDSSYCIPSHACHLHSILMSLFLWLETGASWVRVEAKTKSRDLC